MHIIIMLFFIFLEAVYADITGVVFRDLPLNGSTLNSYGTLDDNEFGVGGVSVKAYSATGEEVASSTTADDGTYTLNISVDGDYRIEFSNWPSYLKESIDGNKSNASIRFAKNGDRVDFGLHNPDDFTSTQNPELITSVYFNGATSGDSGNLRALVVWDYNDTEASSYDVLANKSDIGSVWGLAYNKRTKDIYASAVLKRHVGLLDKDGDGDGDIGVIYKINRDTKAIEEFYRFPKDDVGTIGNDANRSLPEDDGPSTDADAFDKIGNIGLGDIDISSDGKVLYVVNIYNNKLYLIDTATKALLESVEIPKECNVADDTRAFALKYSDGELYVGVTCSAYNSKNKNDLEAIVYRYSGSSNFEQVIRYGLIYYSDGANDAGGNYDENKSKGAAYVAAAGDGSEYGNQFNPWINDWSEFEVKVDFVIKPQPILADIEFIYRNKKKYMVMGFLDRAGLQTGYKNYDTDASDEENDDENFGGCTGGDALIASMNSDGTATLENNGKIDGEGGVSDNDQGPDRGEFFHYDFWQSAKGDIYHEEIVQGGTAYLAGSSSVPFIAFDPANTVNSGGVKFFNNVDGTSDISKILYNGGEENGTQGKSGGLGDLELLTEPAPIEIGNRVWFDSNRDGIQDSNESGIGDVELVLSAGSDCSNIIANTKTDSDGSYIFNQDNVDGGLSPYTQYTVCIDKSQFTNKKGVEDTILEGMVLTTLNVDDNSKDSIDSDINNSEDGLSANLLFTTDDFGENNHSFDIGLVETYCIGDRIWLDKDKDGIQDSDESNVTQEVKVELLDKDGNIAKDANGDDIEPITTTDGTYKFCTLLPDSYKVRITPPDGYIVTTKDSGDDSIDSDIDPATNETDVFSIEDDNMTIDIGLYAKTYCLGDYIWYDNNKNGVQDSDESGVSGVSITLNETGATTITDESGKYEFCELENGDYSITVDKETLPDSYIFTTQNSGGDDTLDSDINPEDGKSNIVTIADSDNMTLDGGIFKTYCLGDYIWYDNNKNGVQDSDESGVSGVSITLNETGATTTTDESGKYEFCGLENGDYSITVDKETLPDNYIFTAQNSGDDDSLDSDINPEDGKSDIATIDNANNFTLDGGIYNSVVSTNVVSTYIPYITPTPTPTIVPTPTPAISETPEPTLTPELTPTPTPTPIVTPTPEPTTLVIEDDVVEINETENGVIVIDALSNDMVHNGALIRLVRITNGDVIANGNRAVSGANLETVDTIVVPGEGVWKVDKDKVIFIPEDGFEGTPSPIYYVVQDENGNYSNVAKIVIDGVCACKDFSSSVPLDNILIFILILLNPITLFLFSRKIISKNMKTLA